jgi:hypothetical protein
LKKISLLISVFIIALFLTGCLNKAVDMSLPYYDGTVNGKLSYPLAAVGETGKDILIVSTDSNLYNIVKQIELPSTGEYSIDLPPGEYYVSAFRDIDEDNSYTFGKEPIAGRITHFYDYFRTFHPVLEKAKTTTVNPVLLKPFDLIKPVYNEVNAELTPEFSWNKISPSNLLRLSS